MLHHKLNLTFFISITIIFHLCACLPSAFNELKTNSDVIDRPAYRDIKDQFNKLAAENSNLVEIIHYGNAVSGEGLFAVSIRNKSLDSNTSSTTKPLFLITDAIHGNEYLGLANLIGKDLIKDPNLVEEFLDTGGELLFIPVVNPDGYEYHRNTNPQDYEYSDPGNSIGRLNKERKDLNREFDVPNEGRSIPAAVEVSAMMQLIKDRTQKGRKLEVNLDYHCCIGQGTLLYPFSYNNQAKIKTEDQGRYETYKNIFKTEIPQTVAGTVLEIAGYNAKGTSLDYFYHNYGSVALTYEGVDKAQVQDKSKHLQIVQKFSQTIAKSYAKIQSTPTQPDSTQISSNLKVHIQSNGKIQLSTTNNVAELRYCLATNELVCSSTQVSSSSIHKVGSQFIANFNQPFLTQNYPIRLILEGYQNNQITLRRKILLTP